MHSTDSAGPRFDGITLLAVLAIALALAALGGLAAVRPPVERLWGDEGTFLAMTASLVRDGDLEFHEADAAWARTRSPGPAVTVILQRADGGITYSKPILYPLLSAPLFALLGESGLLATNLVVLIAALALAWRFLRDLGSSASALWTLATFVCCSVLPAYAGWKMSDLTQAALALAGLILALGGRRLPDPKADRITSFGSTRAAVLGGLLLGAAATMRFPAAALGAAAVAALLLDGRPRRAVAVGGLAALSFFAVSATSHRLLGSANPYKAQRSSFNEVIGYPAGERAEEAMQRFTTHPATHSASWVPPLDARRTAYSALYFWIGRHTGLVLYFPAALVLLVHLLGRPDRQSLALLAGTATVAGFYLLWMPHNYFGGSTFLGNRYFLAAYPALLVGLRRLPPARLLALAWGLAIASWSSALYSVIQVHELDATSQNHTRTGIFRMLPFESTGKEIDGVEDRYWDEDYVRFLDPFARRSTWSFGLDSGQPPAELMIATSWPGDSLLFLVSPDAAGALLEVRDRGGRRSFVLDHEPTAAHGLVEVTTAPAWRRHSLWWKRGQPYAIRTLRLSLRTAAGGRATAAVWYLGRGRELAPLGARLVETELPNEATGGASTQILVRVQNTGRRSWKDQTLLPIRLGYRLRDPAADLVVAQERLALPHEVRGGETFELQLQVSWPRKPADYELVLELLREPSGILGEHGRLQLARQMIRVRGARDRGRPEP